MRFLRQTIRVARVNNPGVLNNNNTNDIFSLSIFFYFFFSSCFSSGRPPWASVDDGQQFPPPVAPGRSIASQDRVYMRSFSTCTYTRFDSGNASLCLFKVMRVDASRPSLFGQLCQPPKDALCPSVPPPLPPFTDRRFPS